RARPRVPLLWAALAGLGDLAAVDGAAALRRGWPQALVRGEHGPDGVDGGIEPVGDLAIGDFQHARARYRRIELRGETRTVGAERVQLGVQRLLAAVGLVSPLDRGRDGIECAGKTLAGARHGAGLGEYPQTQ